MSDVASAILSRIPAQTGHMRRGTVTGTSPLTVDFGDGVDVPCVRLASWTKTLSHFVAVWVAPGDMPLVLGQVAT